MSLSAYGYRRIGAELRHRGIVVNSKKIRRLLREHDLQPRRRRRFVPTTDSNPMARGSPHPADGQKRRVILSTVRSAHRIRGQNLEAD